MVSAPPAVATLVVSAESPVRTVSVLIALQRWVVHLSRPVNKLINNLLI